MAFISCHKKANSHISAQCFILLFFFIVGCESYRIIDPIPETIVGPQQSLNGPYDNLFSSVTISPLSYVTPKRLNRQYNAIVPPNYITLYNSNEDNTIELVDGNITSSIYNSPHLWIVQFYAHWCGHCQRFAPTWKNVANHFLEWNNWVRFGVINCAQAESCNDFNVRGTPTIRIFYPRTNVGEFGLDIKSNNNIAYWKNIVFDHVEISQSKGLFPKEVDIPNLMPLRRDELYKLVTKNQNGINSNPYTSSIDRFGQPTQYQLNYVPLGQDVGSIDTRKQVFIFESSGDDSIGKEVLLQLSNKYKSSVIRRVKWNEVGIFIEFFPQAVPTRFPALVILEATGFARSPWRIWRYYPRGISFGNMVSQSTENLLVKEIDTYLSKVLPVQQRVIEVSEQLISNEQENWKKIDLIERNDGIREIQNTQPQINDYIPEVTTRSAITTSEAIIWDEPPLTTSASIFELEEQVYGEVIYAIDIEKAIQYSLMTEISSQPVLDKVKLEVLYRWLDALTKYVSMNNKIYKFISAIKMWMQQNIGGSSQTKTGNDLSNQLDRLALAYKPFNITSLDWKGCMGSEPQYRGYPCSLWQLFHTITVNAAKDDGSNQFSGLSSTIVDYVQHFFQCRHCAKNFLLKVQSISQGSLPKKPKDIMMWLWRIHNMANVKLAGDITEDPSHPKSLWPSDISCPECRPHPWNIVSSQLNMMQTVDGVLWNLEATSNYLMNLYANDKIVGNTMSGHNADMILNDSPQIQPITQTISQDTISRLQGMDENSRNNLLAAMQHLVTRNATTNQDLVTFYSSFCIAV